MTAIKSLTGILNSVLLNFYGGFYLKICLYTIKF